MAVTHLQRVTVYFDLHGSAVASTCMRRRHVSLLPGDSLRREQNPLVVIETRFQRWRLANDES
jgi:hypothetical protein